MYGKEYEEWREQRALQASALGKLTEDEIDALRKMGWCKSEEQRQWEAESELRRLAQQSFNQRSFNMAAQADYSPMSDAMGPIDLGRALFR